MATVTNTIKLPGGAAPAHASVEISLVASETVSANAAGWINATDVTILSTMRPTVTAGAWSADLTPNADIDPTGTVYLVREYVGRDRYEHYIEVPSGGGTVHDLLTDGPEAIVFANLRNAVGATTFRVEAYLTPPYKASPTAAEIMTAHDAAMTAAEAVGGVVKFTEGVTYEVDAPFRIGTGVTWDCSGAYLKRRDGGSADPLIVNRTWSGDGNPGITIIAHGSTWDYNGRELVYVGGKPYGELGNVAHFQRCDRLRIVGRPRILDGTKIALTIGNSDDVDIDGAIFDTRSDGVHLYPPMARGHFGVFSGTTGDDFFAFTISDYPAQVANLLANGETVSTGDFEDIRIDALLIDNDHLPPGGESYGSGLSMLSGSSSHRFRRIHVGSIVGSAQQAARLTNDGVLTNLMIEDVTIDLISFTRGSGASIINIDVDSMESLTIGAIINRDGGNSKVMNLLGTIGTISVGRFVQRGECTAGLIELSSTATLGLLELRGVDVVLGVNGRLLDLASANPTSVVVDGFLVRGTSTGVGWGYYANGAGATSLAWANGEFRGLLQAGRVDSPASVVATYNNVAFNGGSSMFNCNTGGTMRCVYGPISQVTSSDKSLFGSGTFSASGLNYQVTVGSLNGPQTGDVVVNLSGGPGAGLAKYTGSAWELL